MEKASKEYFRNYYQKRKEEYIKLLGGKCKKCNTIENLEFDHINSSAKRFSIGKLMNFSKEEALKELKKCQLLCSKCHKLKSSKLNYNKILKIKKLLKTKEFAEKDIAKKFNVSVSQINRIKNNKCWKEII